MKALIFAAGLGQRMRPLTLTTPKPLLMVGKKPLIVWHIEKLAALGITNIVINTCWLAEEFPKQLGNGSNWGVQLHYINEGSTPLETGGGMLNALPLLGDSPFLLVNGDIWTDYDFAQLPSYLDSDSVMAHLVLVPPPDFSHGDFALNNQNKLQLNASTLFTYSGLGIYHPALFNNWQHYIEPPYSQPPCFKLAPLLRAYIEKGMIEGEYYLGKWFDIGTPERLQELQKMLEI